MLIAGIIRPCHFMASLMRADEMNVGKIQGTAALQSDCLPL